MEVSSVRPPADMSAGELPDSDWFDDQGDSTAEPEVRAEREAEDVCEICRVECDSVRANWEKVEGAEDRLCIAGAETGMDIDEDSGGDDFRCFRALRYMARSSYERLPVETSSVDVLRLLSVELGSAVCG